MKRINNKKHQSLSEKSLTAWHIRVQQVWLNWSVFLSLLLLVTVINLIPGRSFGEGIVPIDSLKEMFLDTVLVQSGLAEVVIVTPKGKYVQAVTRIKNRVKEISGVDVEVVSAADVSFSLLEKQNVIACGNMADNAFIKELYVKYYTLVDLVYPGEGGHVLRTLHNPLGTGHNVILIGGSDNDGVDVAALHLELLLTPGNPLSVPRIMDIQLNSGTIAPEYEADSIEETVYSWRDSFRRISTGKGFGYPPATFFGWNAISIAGMLYHMTGDLGYLDTFKKLALPQVDRPSARVMNDSAFQDPYNPLVKNDHYRSHLLDIVWDLIEESPGFSNAERLYITNKLLKRQLHYDSESSYYVHTDRHNLWHLMNIYTGSRYFNKYYPNALWAQRLDNVRQAFRTFVGDPTWAVRDSLYWVTTSIEPILEFFIMDGAEEFVNSGTAEQMMQALDILYTGREVDDCNKYASISLLHKAAWLLNEPRYAWMAQRFGYDFGVFRIGQSYWPSFVDIPKPLEIVGLLQTYPLAQTDWDKYGNTVPRDQAFQILSYRSGLEADDDYLLVDGFAGMGRNPYHLGAIKELRLFGKRILSGYENDVDISVDGLVGPKVARAAAIKKEFSQDGVTYLHLNVPDMPGCSWDRHILFVDDEFSLIADDITPLQDGTFDIAVAWQLGGNYTMERDDLVRMVAGPFLQTSWQPYGDAGDRGLVQQASRRMVKGKSETAFTRITSDEPLSVMTSPDSKTLTISGREPAYVKIGPARDADLYIDAEFTYVDSHRICLVDATRFSYKGQTFFSSTTPETGCWELERGELRQLFPESKLISKETSLHNVASGEQGFLEDMTEALAGGALKYLDSPSDLTLLFDNSLPTAISVDGTVDGVIVTSKVVTAEFDNATYFTGQSGETTNIYQLSSNGGVAQVVSLPCSVHTLWTAQSQTQKDKFSLLAGGDDDILRAYGEDGREIWSVTASINESFIVGDRYEAPWFTDPRPPYHKKGITALRVGDFWGSGTEYIAVGRPSTVVFYTLDGELYCSVPIRWGDVSALESVAHAGKDAQPLLLVAKHPAGNPKLSVIDGSCSNISDNYFGNIQEGDENMHAWLQRGLSHMLVTDLDGDGTEELVYTLSGHWNEIRVYDVESFKPEWMHSFGPGKPKSDYVRGLVVCDLDQDGKKEIVIGAETGWIYVFDHTGQLEYSSKQPSAVTGLVVSSSLQQVAIGLEDDPVVLLDVGFHKKSLGEGSRGATVVQWVNKDLYVGLKNEVVKYTVP